MDLSMAAINGSDRQRGQDGHCKQRASQGVEIRNVWCLIENKEEFVRSICVKRYFGR